MAMLRAQKLDASNYNKWNNYEDVMNWILSLENGYYNKYKNELKQSLEEQKVNGKFLAQNKIKKQQIRKWGIDHEEDCIKLAGHILFLKTWKTAKTALSENRLFRNSHLFTATFDAKNVKNVLVICIGIVEYDDFQPLPDIVKDLDLYRNILGDKYGYVIVSNDDFENMKQFGYYLNDEKLIEFLLKCKNKICSEYDASELLFDGIIIALSGHGVKDGIVCSNGHCVSYTEIRSIFCDPPVLTTIPRIFLIDACRTGKIGNGDNIFKAEYKFKMPSKTYSVTITGAENNTVRGGKIAQYITKAMSRGYKIKKYKNFGDICTEASNTIEQATNNEQTLVRNEPDDKVFNIILKPNDGKRLGGNTETGDHEDAGRGDNDDGDRDAARDDHDDGDRDAARDDHDDGDRDAARDDHDDGDRDA
eukprot:49085_1